MNQAASGFSEIVTASLDFLEMPEVYGERIFVSRQTNGAECKFSRLPLVDEESEWHPVRSFSVPADVISRRIGTHNTVAIALQQ